VRNRPENYLVLYDIATTHEEISLNRKVAFGFYEQFLEKCPNRSSAEAMYAASRMVAIKEKFFHDGEQ